MLVPDQRSFHRPDWNIMAKGFSEHLPTPKMWVRYVTSSYVLPTPLPFHG